MLSTLLAAAALSVTSLLPLPLPLPTHPSDEPTVQTDPVVLSGALDAPDGRLKRGCKDYAYAYAVTTESEDWTFDITMQDREGRGVNAQSLIGPNDAESGVLTYRLCRWATTQGRFTLTGVLTSYEGTTSETSVEVTDTFRLRKRNG
ncbi:hypothetical protein EXE59_15725 [Nocardioides eburneiflavus]|uniref:Uncharacterized protein n=1 Tax=Nocardioides eburneiflavus TaxID=2518372 RepID=A0A4Z1CG05_9ACTN|nr:hypothetical protein [Nocardioides eburneiflavus]TGN65245.1 hypothetical protein EXE59_15725 [Nocardioides eburneiflavus]